ncbi:MAG: TIGR04076 family protein [candidate division KSB1 bacterium]|nr:TIGR04076 family protein [candidate division KSB1 bacterium]MDZ7334823.1 TIGR04076 family protein [candidate division KSB1 bacterium]MDZ7356547.1 TIGR04076 family protein [candidate division KSB1 bacterium]MDZ7376292.1 TIGR04076 family protein [candidate division KSB1 bacterium]MDZ7400448.1 TIGR04076 family protein [candidate division KSB1 bacterium]
MGYDLKITIRDVRGFCPIYHPGDCFWLEQGYIINPEKARRICLHSLASLLPYHVALSHGVAPIAIGLNKRDENRAYVQCLDPCEWTGGGTVTFEVEIQS